MNESIVEMQRLLQDVAAQLKSGTKPNSREAVNKLKRIAALASTLTLTIEGRR